MAVKPRRPGDQPLPVPGRGVSMHDLVIEDLLARPGTEHIIELFRERKGLGLDRYGSLLLAFNGRSGRQDLAEELADAAVYSRQLSVEQEALKASPAVLFRLDAIGHALLFMLEDLCTLDLKEVKT